jgi:hypothetical protein
MYNNYYDSEFINSYNNDISNLPSFYNSSINGAPFDNDRFFNLNNEAEMFTYENNGHLYFIEDNILNKNEDNDKYKVKLKTTKSTKSSPFFEFIKEPKTIKRGPKPKGSIGGKHNKFSKDNLIRKIKSKLMTAILSYINSLLEKYYLQNEIKSVVLLQKVDQKYIKDTRINFNIKLFNLKIKDIFSDRISLKYKALGRNFNKNLINKICQGKSQKNIIDTLEMTFLECLEHVSGKKHYESLNGLEKEFQLIVNNMNETDKYIEAFTNLLNKFEFHFKNTTPKKKLVNKNFYLK